MIKRTFCSALGAGMSAAGECYLQCPHITPSAALAILVVVVVTVVVVVFLVLN